MKQVAVEFVRTLLKFPPKQCRVAINEHTLIDVSDDPDLLKSVTPGDET